MSVTKSGSKEDVCCACSVLGYRIPTRLPDANFRTIRPREPLLNARSKYLLLTPFDVSQSADLTVAAKLILGLTSDKNPQSKSTGVNRNEV